MITLNDELYNTIFFEHNFEGEEADALCEKGFLVKKDCDEVLEMRKLRNIVIENSSEKIANIIIAPTLECNARCYHCFGNGYRKGRMSIETAKELVTF